MHELIAMIVAVAVAAPAAQSIRTGKNATGIAYDVSAGSSIALDAALDQPARVERLVLAGPAIGGLVSKALPPFPPELMRAIRAGEKMAA